MKMKRKYLKVIFFILIVFLSFQVISASNEKVIGEIIFYANSDEIKEKSLPVLNKITELLIKDKTVMIQIKGHTNSIGNPEGEKELSEMRALKIANILEKNGISANRISTIGFAGTMLKINMIDEGNRRAEIVLNKEGKIETSSNLNLESINPDVDKRILDLTVVNKNNDGISANIEIKKREKGNVIYSDEKVVNTNAKLEIPKGDAIELIVTASDYVPKKVIIEASDLTSKIILDKIEKNKIVNIDNVYFRINQALIKIESYDILNELTGMLKDNPGIYVEVYGHTDNTSNEKSNYVLSMKRADAVAKYLIKNGIAEERISSKGFGSKKPVASNSSENGRKKNRRTEFLLK